MTFRCDDLHIDEARDLEPPLPFADWTRAYATGYWTRDALLGIGLAIGTWLDGPQSWLTRLAQAAAPVVLIVEVSKTPDSIEQAVLDAPWELIARAHSESDGAAYEPEELDERVPLPISALLTQLGAIDWQYVHHAALEPSFLLTVVRRLGQSDEPLKPSKYRLSVVFMPCQPDGTLDLSVDTQEVAIRKASGSGIDLQVEDFGSLDGLGDLIGRLGGCDVVHMSCPATMSPSPALALEGVRGERADATGDQIWLKIANRPRLLVVSAYAGLPPGPSTSNTLVQNASTVEVGSRVLGPLATELCKRDWPAVLGLPGATTDIVEVNFVAALYRLLAQRVSLLDAFVRARLPENGTASTGLWHKARLLLGPKGGGQLIDGAKAHQKRLGLLRSQQFLDLNRQLRIATNYQTSLHRRALQEAVATLRDDVSRGIAVHGGDEPSRATFVSHVLQRVEGELRRVVVSNDFDAPAILRAVREQTANPRVATIARKYRDTLQGDPQQLQEALRAIVEGPCRDRGAGAFVLVLHNFDLAVADAVVLRALLDAFVGARKASQLHSFVEKKTASRLLFTCPAPFSGIDYDDLSQPLVWLHLEPAKETTDPPPPPPPPWWWLISLAGLAVAGLAVAGLAVAVAVIWRQRTSDQSSDQNARNGSQRFIDESLPAVPNMVGFKAADVSMGKFAAGTRPAECNQLSVEEHDCAEWRNPEAARITHVRPFYLDKQEVTNDGFSAWLNAHSDDWLAPEDGVVKGSRDHLPLVQTEPCSDGLAITSGHAQPTAGSAQRPVVCVTWLGATKYCDALGKRLPYEAEWELAAKGVDGRPFPWGTDPPRPGQVAYELELPRDVGTSHQDVSPEGIYDLGGNVAEWVESELHPDGQRKVARGGDFNNHGPCPLLGSSCLKVPPFRFVSYIGFRCARGTAYSR